MNKHRLVACFLLTPTLFDLNMVKAFTSPSSISCSLSPEPQCSSIAVTSSPSPDWNCNTNQINKNYLWELLCEKSMYNHMQLRVFSCVYLVYNFCKFVRQNASLVHKVVFICHLLRLQVRITEVQWSLGNLRSSCTEKITKALTKNRTGG